MGQYDCTEAQIELVCSHRVTFICPLQCACAHVQDNSMSFQLLYKATTTGISTRNISTVILYTMLQRFLQGRNNWVPFFLVKFDNLLPDNSNI